MASALDLDHVSK
jgi:ABC-2 type transport system ATP-binding protein